MKNLTPNTPPLSDLAESDGGEVTLLYLWGLLLLSASCLINIDS